MSLPNFLIILSSDPFSAYSRIMYKYKLSALESIASNITDLNRTDILNNIRMIEFISAIQSLSEVSYFCLSLVLSIVICLIATYCLVSSLIPKSELMYKPIPLNTFPHAPFPMLCSIHYKTELLRLY